MAYFALKRIEGGFFAGVCWGDLYARVGQELALKPCSGELPNPERMKGLIKVSKRFVLLFLLLFFLRLPTTSVAQQANDRGDRKIAAKQHFARAQVSVERNLNLELAEGDKITSLKIEESLNGFLTEAQNNDYSEDYVSSKHLREFKFFFDRLAEIGKNSEGFHSPLILKSFPVENGSYRLTVAFTGVKDERPFVYQVTEFKAIPFQRHFRFYCPFRDNTAHFKSKRFDHVTYHFSDSIDENEADEFVRFSKESARKTNGPIPELDYYAFNSLDELLKSYGFLYSARQCNFLRYDLGFTDNEGKTFITGTGNADYRFGFIPDYLRYYLPDSESIYPPFAFGIAAYYGGYGLSYDDIEKLKHQFREKLKESPNMDFLKEFKKGRASSVNRHFSSYVMSAFLFEEAIKKKGFQEAIKLVYTGNKGEYFFENLNDILEIDESDFHHTILRLIGQQ